MKDKAESLQICDNKILHHFELHSQGYIARIEYHISDGQVFLDHLVIPFELMGKGVTQSLVRKTLEYLGDQKLKIVPVCPPVRKYLKEHHEFDYLTGMNIIA
ncbi:MAG: N-acetyltransferase [Bacteroidetes bacterium]|nr:N-acetyltransferase [Bacteroidota bacterium]